VLQHLDRRGEVELVLGERQPRGLLGPELQVRALAPIPLGAQLRVLEVDPDDPTVTEALRPLDRQHALAAAHVEHRGRRRLRPELVERRVEAAHKPLHDRIRRAVLVERVSGRDLGRGRAAAHSFSASRSSALPVARPDCAPVVAGWSLSPEPGS
jgi:hypothetical protein